MANQHQRKRVTMSSNSTDDHHHHPFGGQNGFIHKNDVGTIIRDAHRTRRREQENGKKKSDKNVVIALPATNVEEQHMKGEKKRKMDLEAESEKAEERQDVKESEEDEEGCDEHWIHNFSRQLIEANGGMPPREEQVAMIPNPFFKDFFYL